MGRDADRDTALSVHWQQLTQGTVDGVFIDQDEVRANRVRRVNESFWRELFESVDIVCRMQLVICPDSSEHHDDSLKYT